MLLVSSCVPVITLLCSRVMRFQSRPTNSQIHIHLYENKRLSRHPKKCKVILNENRSTKCIYIKTCLHISTVHLPGRLLSENISRFPHCSPVRMKKTVLYSSLQAANVLPCQRMKIRRHSHQYASSRDKVLQLPA